MKEPGDGQVQTVDFSGDAEGLADWMSEHVRCGLGRALTVAMFVETTPGAGKLCSAQASAAVEASQARLDRAAHDENLRHRAACEARQRVVSLQRAIADLRTRKPSAHVFEEIDELEGELAKAKRSLSVHDIHADL